MRLNAMWRCLAIMSILLMMGGCTQGKEGKEDTRALIEDPRAGDIYAAELTYFSEADFESQPRVYGLLKVVESIDGNVTVITEDAGSGQASVALGDIAGDLSGIGFDDSERIVISHPDLVKAFEDGKIMSARRD